MATILTPESIVDVAKTEIFDHKGARLVLDKYQVVFPRDVAVAIVRYPATRQEYEYARNVARVLDKGETIEAIKASRVSRRRNGGRVPAWSNPVPTFGILVAIARLEARKQYLGMGRYIDQSGWLERETEDTPAHLTLSALMGISTADVRYTVTTMFMGAYS